MGGYDLSVTVADLVYGLISLVISDIRHVTARVIARRLKYSSVEVLIGSLVSAKYYRLLKLTTRGRVQAI